MIFSPDKKRHIFAAGSILLALSALIIGTNIFLGNFIEQKLKTAFTGENSRLYTISINKVRSNILTGNIRITNIQLKPVTTLLKKVQRGTATSAYGFCLDIPELRLRGINMIALLSYKNINIDKIECNSPNLTILKGKQPELSPISSKSSEIDFNLDSIQINGIAGIELGKIVFNKLKFTYIDLPTSDTIVADLMIDTEFSGLELNRLPDNKKLFKVDLNNLDFEMYDQEILLSEGDYKLTLDRLNFGLLNGELSMKGLKLKPSTNNAYKLAKKRPYSSEVYSIEVDNIHLKNLDLIDLIDQKKLILDSLLLSGMDISILKDKSLPFNTKLRPQLPHQLLKNMKFPLYIGELQIENSNLSYQEKLPEIKEPMTVLLHNLNINISRATSIKDSMRIQKNMIIQLQSDLMKKAKMRVEFVFPLYMEADTFFYAGLLGPAHLPLFNKVTTPSLGARFTDGELQSIQFKGSGNCSINSGEMTMLYNKLKAEISRKDLKTKNKIVSWAANTALLNSNPGNNGKIRVAQMYSQRVAYKGFGNFMWKTLQNGITSTVLPTGEIDKIDNEATKEERKKDKMKKKQDRREKRSKD